MRNISKHRRGQWLALTIAFVGAGVSSAHAAMYDYFYAASANSFMAPAGSTLTLNIYLEEEANAGAPSPSLINDDLGLYTGAFTITPSSTSATSSKVLSVAGNQGVEPLGFSTVVDHSVDPTTGVGSVSENADINAPVDVLAAPVPTAGYASAVLLGSVTIKVGSAGSVTTFTPGANDGTASIDYTFDASDDLALYDTAAPTPFTVTATGAVPEPATLATAALAGVALRRRRRA